MMKILRMISNISRGIGVVNSWLNINYWLSLIRKLLTVITGIISLKFLRLLWMECSCIIGNITYIWGKIIITNTLIMLIVLTIIYYKTQNKSITSIIETVKIASLGISGLLMQTLCSVNAIYNGEIFNVSKFNLKKNYTLSEKLAWLSEIKQKNTGLNSIDIKNWSDIQNSLNFENITRYKDLLEQLTNQLQLQKTILLANIPQKEAWYMPMINHPYISLAVITLICLGGWYIYTKRNLDSIWSNLKDITVEHLKITRLLRSSKEDMAKLYEIVTTLIEKTKGTITVAEGRNLITMLKETIQKKQNLEKLINLIDRNNPEIVQLRVDITECKEALNKIVDVIHKYNIVDFSEIGK